MKIARKEWKVNSTKKFYLEKHKCFRRVGRLFSPLPSEEDAFWILYFGNDCKEKKNKKPLISLMLSNIKPEVSTLNGSANFILLVLLQRYFLWKTLVKSGHSLFKVLFKIRIN